MTLFKFGMTLFKFGMTAVRYPRRIVMMNQLQQPSNNVTVYLSLPRKTAKKAQNRRFGARSTYYSKKQKRRVYANPGAILFYIYFIYVNIYILYVITYYCISILLHYYIYFIYDNIYFFIIYIFFIFFFYCFFI